jgi:hypothetical protein
VAGGLAAGGSIGLVPASLAKAASLRQRPAWENDTMAWAALTGPIPGWLSSPGTRSGTMAASSVRLVASARPASRSARPGGGSRRGARPAGGLRGQAGGGEPSWPRRCRSTAPGPAAHEGLDHSTSPLQHLRPDPDGQRVAIFYTKVHNRLLRPLTAANDHPPRHPSGKHSE